MLPKKLFKYQPFADYAIGNLAARQVYFCRPTAFNDPFEFHARFTAETLTAEEKDALIEQGLRRDVGGIEDAENLGKEAYLTDLAAAGERGQKRLAEEGVACFSAINDHPLMWAHYAAGHTGFCLEFSTDSEIFASALQVDYVKEAPLISPADWSLGKGWSRYMRLAAATKLETWSYEQEWRCLHASGDTSVGYEARHLTAVHLGLRMAEAHELVVKAVLANTATKIFRMTESSTGYGVESAPASQAANAQS